MRILTFDVGVGTIDVLIWDTNEVNIFKLVLPSPCQYFTKKIKKSKENLLIDGIEMGGFPISSAIFEHIKKGFKVYMSDTVWKTIKYDRNYVLEKGIHIINDKEKLKLKNSEKNEELFLTDVEIDYFFKIFKKFGLSLDFDYIGIAVQDHGVPDPSIKTKNFRREWIVDILKKSPEFDKFLFPYNKIPKFLSRSNSIAKYVYQKTGTPVFVSDTSISAMKGCLYHPNLKFDKIVAMDIGNGHTCAFSIDNNEILGYFEYHTKSITVSRLEWAIRKLIDGTLTNEEVIREKGHGAFVKRGLNKDFELIVTGPRRSIMRNTQLKYILGAPFGDHMITGAVGLAKMIFERVSRS
ncbi:MAG: DUF1786 family protein [Candidatus Helarchaeota archaeon]